MKSIRAILFPRENVPLAVHTDAGSGLEMAASNHDLWRESDRFMRTEEFTQPITKPRKWVRHKTTWDQEEW